MIKLRQYLLGFCCFLCGIATSQNRCNLYIHDSEKNDSLLNTLQISKIFVAKAQCLQYVKQLPVDLALQGYISASVDSLREDSSDVFVTLFVGKKYVWQSLKIPQQHQALMEKIGFLPESFPGKLYNEQEIRNLNKRVLDYLADNGHPFASTGIDSVLLNNGKVEAVFKIDTGSFYTIDTITITGNAKISRDYLLSYLGIRQGMYYDQSVINDIGNKITELVFITEAEPRSVEMVNTGAMIRLVLQNRPSNQVNVLVGFLPQNQQTGGKLLLTGEANLNLRNPFGHGEIFILNWQQLQYKSPGLKISFQRPYLFKTAVGLTMDFELFKRDSFFLNIQAAPGLQYVINSRQNITAAYQLNSTTLLSVDTNQVILTKRLPDIADVHSGLLALQYSFNNTNYRFNPRKGNDLFFELGFGRKKIEPNSTITGIKGDGFNYASLYDTVEKKTYLLKSVLHAAHYFATGKQSTVKAAVYAGWLQSQNYFQNELFRLGGYRLLRGFDEESIYANRYAVFSAEYRYLLGINSWLFGFTDAGTASYAGNSGKYSHFYLGFGGGLAFETNSGIINISWAVGKRNDLNFDLRQSKIHIGFVSLF